MKVFITKYALTSGIKEIEAEETTIPGMIKDTGQRFTSMYHTEGKDWHRTIESAVKRAEDMRDRKIASLKKQLGKLENMEF